MEEIGPIPRHCMHDSSNHEAFVSLLQDICPQFAICTSQNALPKQIVSTDRKSRFFPIRQWQDATRDNLSAAVASITVYVANDSVCSRHSLAYSDYWINLYRKCWWLVKPRAYKNGRMPTSSATTFNRWTRVDTRTREKITENTFTTITTS